MGFNSWWTNLVCEVEWLIIKLHLRRKRK